MALGEIQQPLDAAGDLLPALYVGWRLDAHGAEFSAILARMARHAKPEDEADFDPDTPPYAASKASADDIADIVVSKLVNRPRRVKPIPLWMPGPSKVTAAGPLTFNFIDLGGPPTPNRIWNVLRYSVSGIDPFTAVTGSVIAFVNPNAPVDSSTEPMIINLVGLAVSIPASAAWAGHQLTLRYGEHIILGFKGVPAATQLNTWIQVEEEDLNDFRVDRDP